MGAFQGFALAVFAWPQGTKKALTVGPVASRAVRKASFSGLRRACLKSFRIAWMRRGASVRFASEAPTLGQRFCFLINQPAPAAKASMEHGSGTGGGPLLEEWATPTSGKKPNKAPIELWALNKG